MKKLLQKSIVSAVLLNLLVLNFVSAQSPLPANPIPNAPTQTPGATNPNTSQAIADKAAYLAAQQSRAACITFRNLVYNVSGGQAKAVWFQQTTTSGRGPQTTQLCAIVPANFADTNGIDGNPQGRPTIYQQLEQQILNGNGLTLSAWTEAQNQYNKTQGEANGVSKVVGWILDAVLSVIATALAVVAAIAGKIFSYSVYQVTNVTSMPTIVDVGWGIIRDICNVLFILILIVIALSTILRFKEYDEYGHLLSKLIVAALLVNFSKVIAVTIINFVNLIATMFYANGMGMDIFKTLMQIADPAGDFKAIAEGGWMAAVTLGIGKVLYMIIATGVFLILAGLFVIRLVGLYVLVIFSPLAYVLNILPATEHYAEEWWHWFVKYLIWAPVALFMIRLNIVVVKNNFASWFDAGPNGGAINDSAFIYFILCAFLAAAFFVAEEAGMVGSKYIVGAVEKGLHTGYEATDRWLARGANRTGDGGIARTRRGLSYLSLGAWKQGFQQRAHQQEHESYLVAAGRRQDVLNKALGGHKTDFGLKAEQQLVSDERKQILTKGNTELIAGMQDALHSKEGEKAFAYAQTLFENYDGNEALSRLGYGTDHEGFQKFIDENFVPIMGQKRAYRLGYDLSRTAEEANHWNYARAYRGNVEKDGSVSYVKNEDAAGEVLSEIAKMNPQQADRTLNRLGRGFMEVDTAEAPVVEEVDGEIRFKRDASGKIVTQTGRVNLGLADWGVRNRQTIDPKAAGDTFNLNTASNYMFNDSTGTLDDNKALWLTLANRFSRMSTNQVKQARTLVSSSGMKASRDSSGNVIRYQATDAEVISGQRKSGQVKYEVQTEDEIKSRVFNSGQAYNFYKSKKINSSDLADFKELRSKIIEYADKVKDKDPEAKRIIDELNSIQDKKDKK